MNSILPTPHTRMAVTKTSNLGTLNEGSGETESLGIGLMDDFITHYGKLTVGKGSKARTNCANPFL